MVALAYKDGSRVMREPPAGYSTGSTPPTFSAVPHRLLLDRLVSDGAKLTFAVLQMHWWQGGECWASHATLAAERGCSERQVQRHLIELEQAGYIASRQHGHGQAKAYAPVQPDISVITNTTPVSPLESNTTPVSAQPDTGVVLNPTPVSYRRRHSEKDSPKEEDKSIPASSAEQEIFAYYRERIQLSARLCPAEKIRARLKTFSADELKQGIEHFAADSWWMENNGARGAAWFFHSDSRSEQFLNLKPRTPGTRSSANGSAPRRMVSEDARRAAAAWEPL